MKVAQNDVTILFDEETLRFVIEKESILWTWQPNYVPHMVCEEGEILFNQARNISHKEYQTGLGAGILSSYEGFEKDGVVYDYSFQTFVWAEASTGNVYFEWIPVKEEGLHIKKLFWPGDMNFEEKKDSWYTILTHQQGMLVPNTWETELSPVVFDGFFGTAGGYMPWFGQVKDRAGYIAISLTPWNAGYHAEHPAGGPYTHVGVWYEPSLGKMDYRRVLRYTFVSDCDYNDLCKIYRAYVNEQGNLRTLEEKAARNASVNDLIGCAFVHKGIKTVVQPNSDFFDVENPDKNNHLTTFAQREKEIRELRAEGVEKLYMHLDGWAEPGYDNQHPDYTPACEAAGGWEGMKSLADAMHECGYLFGIHDQYRDYYLAAATYDENFACMLADGTIPGHQRWAGGPQTFLCGTQAPYYVKRNFQKIEENCIKLDCAYLDVFTCNEGDECDNPMHRMTRKDCYDYRCKCFEYLLSKGILTSSEEVSDWAVPSLVFCHYAPYDFMMKKPGSAKEAIPVPLYNLVYHDCVIQPWMMEKVSEEEDYMLYALLNGGAPYLIRDAAYPNTDGAFDDGISLKLEEDIRRSKVVSTLHEKVGKCEMVKHEILDGNWKHQRTTFSNGTTVTVDFEKQTYEISE